MKYRVYITGSPIAREAMETIQRENCQVRVGNPMDTPEDIRRNVIEFSPHALIVRQGKIGKEVLTASENLRVICKHGTGTDNIDITAATDLGLPVLFTPGTNVEAVAQHTIGMLLSLTRKIQVQDTRVRKGIFEKKEYDGIELTGKTMGIIGFGGIGRRVAELSGALGMHVLAFHPSFSAESLPPFITKVDHPGRIFSESDVISLHCPLTDETRHLIDASAISSMKKGVYIINTARGAIIKTGDLIEALQDGRIAGAALDVLETEPPDTKSPLFRMKQVIFSSHVAGMSDLSMKNMGMTAVNNVLSVLKGEPIDETFLVNKSPATALFRSRRS